MAGLRKRGERLSYAAVARIGSMHHHRIGARKMFPPCTPGNRVASSACVITRLRCTGDRTGDARASR